MTGLFKFNNSILFLLGLYIPFVRTFTQGGHSVANLQQLAFLLVIYFFAIVKNSSLNINNSEYVKSPITKYLILFYVMGIISTFFAENLDLAAEELFYNLQFLTIYLILSYVTFYEGAVKAIYKGLLLGFLLAMFIGLMQYLGVPGFSIFSADELNQNTLYVSDDALINVVRIWGPFGNALTFSEYLSIAGIILFYYFKYYKLNRLLAYIILGLTIFGISLTLSRTAFLALCTAVFLVEFLMATKKRRIIYTISFVFTIFCLSILLGTLSNNNPIISRLMESQSDFKHGRLDLWLTGFKVLADMPFFGAGPGNLNIEMHHHGWSFLNRKAITQVSGHVENYYLTVLFTWGIVGFIFYLCFMYSYFKAATCVFFAAFKYNKEAFRITVPLLGGFVCFAINNITNPVLVADQRIQLLFIMLLVIINAYYKNYIADKANDAKEKQMEIKRGLDAQKLIQV